MNTSTKSVGLRQRIATAETHEDIDNLLKEGREFEQPSFKTMRQWQVTAAKRHAELIAKGTDLRPPAPAAAPVSNGRAERRRARRAAKL